MTNGERGGATMKRVYEKHKTEQLFLTKGYASLAERNSNALLPFVEVRALLLLWRLHPLTTSRPRTTFALLLRRLFSSVFQTRHIRLITTFERTRIPTTMSSYAFLCDVYT